MKPMPSSFTRRTIRATFSSLTLPWRMCPHQISTSVLLSDSSETPWSGSVMVAVTTSQPSAA